MKKKKHLSIVIIVCLSLTVAFFPIMNVHAKEKGKVYKWKMFFSYPTYVLPIFPKYPEMVKKATNGQLELKLFFKGEHPFGASEVLTALRKNACQIAEVESAYAGGLEPALGLVTAPMLSGTFEERRMGEEALIKSGILKTIFNKYNSQSIASWHWWGISVATRDTLVTKIDSLKGLKIRVPEKHFATYIKWLGGTPMTTDWAEVYTALQRGVIDGSTGSYYGIVKSKWDESCKYITRFAECTSTDRIVMNNKAFDKLPKGVQEGLLKATKEFEQMQRQKIYLDDSKCVMQSIHESYVTVTAIPKDVRKELQKRAIPYMIEHARKEGKLAPEALEVILKVRGWK